MNKKEVKRGDKVLAAQRKTTTKPPFDPNPYTIREVKGTQVTVEREGGQIKKRNLAKVKILKERPERLKPKRSKTVEQEEEDSEWFELPNSKADSKEGQDAQAAGAGGGSEQQAEGHQHLQEAEAGQAFIKWALSPC